jgi:hypothetical protein
MPERDRKANTPYSWSGTLPIAFAPSIVEALKADGNLDLKECVVYVQRTPPAAWSISPQ